MPKIIQNEELTAVLDAIKALPAAAAFEEIASRVTLKLPRRTLQRRLALLVKQGRLVATSARGGRRYQVKAQVQREELTYAQMAHARVAHYPVDFGSASTFVVEEHPLTPAGDGVPLSTEAKDIRHNVTRSLAVRESVGYKPEFLEAYQPNVTAYLPLEIRRKLMRLGRTSSAPLPAGTYLRKVLDRLLIDLSWNSSRLEGNTYSLLETERLLQLGEGADGKDTREVLMILNHKAAIEMLAEQSEEIGFNRYTICNLHALLADQLLQSQISCGRLRDEPVGITGTVYHPLNMPQALEEHFEMILKKADAIEDPFEQAFFAMVHLPYLQPFEDVNKRVSRLAANIPLVKHNLSPLSFVDVPQLDYVQAVIGVYELNRVEYLRDVFVYAYERSCARYAQIRQCIGAPNPFLVRHRLLLADVVVEVVRGGMDKTAAVACIRLRAERLPVAEDRLMFLELAEVELMSLHDGNFARFRLRPSEYAAWKKGWR